MLTAALDPVIIVYYLFPCTEQRKDEDYDEVVEESLLDEVSTICEIALETL